MGVPEKVKGYHFQKTFPLLDKGLVAAIRRSGNFFVFSLAKTLPDRPMAGY